MTAMRSKTKDAINYIHFAGMNLKNNHYITCIILCAYSISAEIGCSHRDKSQLGSRNFHAYVQSTSPHKLRKSSNYSMYMCLKLRLGE